MRSRHIWWLAAASLLAVCLGCGSDIPTDGHGEPGVETSQAAGTEATNSEEATIESSSE